MFPPTFKIDPHEDKSSEMILNYLLAIDDNKEQFPSITVAKYDWVRNPYACLLYTSRCV